MNRGGSFRGVYSERKNAAGGILQGDDLPPGTRVRARRASAMSGWKGTATILNTGIALKDGRTDWLGTIEACRHEWVVLRDQTPNPEHTEAVTNFDAWLAAN